MEPLFSSRDPASAKLILDSLRSELLDNVAPSFQKVTLDATVHLVNASSQETKGAAAQTFDTDDVEKLDVGLTVGNLPSALGGVVSVTPSATFEQAITLMLLDDYSQLAVVSGRRTIRGAVTWKTIAQARHANPSATFSDAINQQVEVVSYDRDLVDVLSALIADDYILVRDENNALAGIVTTADLVHAYGTASTVISGPGQRDHELCALRDTQGR